MSTTWRETADPVVLWQQWCDTATAAWAEALRGDGESYTRPFAPYREWMIGFADWWAQSSESTVQPASLPAVNWEEWIETVGRAWETVAQAGADVVGLTTQEYFSTLQQPTRPDLAPMVEQVGALEDKVERLEGEFQRFSDNDAKLINRALAQSDALESVDHRLTQMQSLLVLGSSAQVGPRLDRLERQLDQMETAVGQIKGTLQQLLTTVEKSAAAPATAAKEASGEERKATTKRTPTEHA
jgi:hypothetical protein